VSVLVVRKPFVPSDRDTLLAFRGDWG